MLRIFLFIFCLPISAYAQGAEAVSAFAKGDFLRAADLAEEAVEADSLAFAARSVLANAMVNSGGMPEQEHLERAEALALRAMDINDGHIDGQMQLAIAFSLQARPLSNRQAMRSGLGQKARRLAEDILLEDADNAYAHALLAIWNMEVLRRGGRIGARIMGASAITAMEHYDAARLATPDDGSLHWQWARVLAATNAKRYKEHIDVALLAAAAANTDDALEAAMKARAAKFKQDIETLSYDEIEALAASLL